MNANNTTKSEANRESLLSEIIKLFEGIIGLWDQGALDEKTGLREHLNLDDIDYWEILLNIENAFKITLDENEFFKCQTVGDIVSLLDQTINEHGSNN